jgi:hypothetical protein
MMAELETMRMPARKSPCLTSQPRASATNRLPFNTSTAPMTVATTTVGPSRLSRRMLRLMPMLKIRKTNPSWASVCTRSKSATKENGGVKGPITTPAPR